MGNHCCADEKDSGHRVDKLPDETPMQAADAVPEMVKAAAAKAKSEEAVAKTTADETAKSSGEETVTKETEVAEKPSKKEPEENKPIEEDTAAKNAEKAAASATECEFTISLKKADSSVKWGFGILENGEQLCIQKACGTAMDEWHKDNPSKQVRFGDEIVSLNGKTGDFKTLMEMIKDSNDLEIVLRRQLEICVSAPKPIGLELEVDASKVTLEIKKIMGGSIQAYNKSCSPNVELGHGDTLVSVNGKTTDLLEEIKQASVTEPMRLVFQRPKIS